MNNRSDLTVTHRTRRQALQTVGLTSLGVLAGCGGLPNQFRPRVHNSDAVITSRTAGRADPWPTLGHDAQRTNAAPRPGPTTDVSLRKLRAVGTFPQTQPIIAADLVVVPAVFEKGPLASEDDEFGQRFEAVAIDSKETVWTLATPVHPAPALVAGRTAFCPFFDTTVAVDTRDGSIYWRYAAGSGLDTGSPALLEGTLFVPDRRRVVALDAVTGKKRWESEQVFEGNVLGVAVTTDIVLASGGSSGDPLVGFDRRTGAVRWSVSSVGKTLPVTDGESVYVMDNRRLAARSVTDGHQVWTRPDVDDSHRPAVADSTVYTPSAYEDGQRALLAVEPASGETRWRTPIGPAVLTGPPVVSTESVYVQTGRDGQVLIIAYDRATGERRWERSLPLGLTDALALGDEALYLLGQPASAESLNTGGVYVIE